MQLSCSTGVAVTSVICLITGYLAFSRSHSGGVDGLDILFLLSLCGFLVCTIGLLVEFARSSLSGSAFPSGKNDAAPSHHTLSTPPHSPNSMKHDSPDDQPIVMREAHR